ncbi:MaoC-like dehydratase [Purpureocillium lavendulum]|uniref:MaoC-like dehydratase n=1 Tax=Purpureocillium lavendulum TaxID=1247861 RepID=A0AB34G686_9HYPO|nr:MaoC-like dehydratase [Purpureocillium lavendulum]
MILESIAILALVAFLAYKGASRLQQLWHLYRLMGTTRFNMPMPVSRLGALDVATVILLMVVKYVYSVLGLLPKLQPDDDGVHIVLPEVTAIAKLRVTSRDERRFDDAAGGPGKDRSNRHNRIMFLPALVNPMLSLLLANRNCPVLPFGCVNTQNSFEIRDPTISRDAAALGEDNCIVMAFFGGPERKGRRVKRGMEFDIRIAVIKFDSIGHGDSVMEQVITILAYLPSSAKPRFRPAENTIDEPSVAWSTTSTNKVTLDLLAPRSWAAVCKDYNPIHMIRPMAKLFGFPGTIAHGNHVLAVATQQLLSVSDPDERVDDQVRRMIYREASYVLKVAFKRPMVLPVSLNVEYGLVDGGGLGLRVVGGGKEYLTAWMM